MINFFSSLDFKSYYYTLTKLTIAILFFYRIKISLPLLLYQHIQIKNFSIFGLSFSKKPQMKIIVRIEISLNFFSIISANWIKATKKFSTTEHIDHSITKVSLVAIEFYLLLSSKINR